MTVSITPAQNAGQVGFESDSIAVNEQAAYRTVLVKRAGGSDGVVSVNHSTADGAVEVRTFVLNVGPTAAAPVAIPNAVPGNVVLWAGLFLFRHP